MFEFKFGLEFKFKTDVTYSLEFREFCLAILYKNRCGFVVKKIGLVFSLSIYSFDLFNNYFMVYYFNGIIKHNIKQMEIQITT